MLATVERPHAGPILGPDAEILELVVQILTGVEYFTHVTPVHTDVVNGRWDAVLFEARKGRFQELGELALGHFTRTHGELVVLDLAFAADEAFDADVVRWVGKDQRRLLAVHERLVADLLGGIATVDAVLTELPKVTKLGDDKGCLRHFFVGRILSLHRAIQRFDLQINLTNGKPNRLDIEVEINDRKLFKLNRQRFFVPGRHVTEPVVSNGVGLHLIGRQMREANDRHLGQLEMQGRFQSCMTSDDHVVSVDGNRDVEAKRIDALGQCGKLTLLVRSGVSRVGFELLGIDVADGDLMLVAYRVLIVHVLSFE